MILIRLAKPNVLFDIQIKYVRIRDSVLLLRLRKKSQSGGQFRTIASYHTTSSSLKPGFGTLRMKGAAVAPLLLPQEVISFPNTSRSNQPKQPKQKKPSLITTNIT